MSTPNFTYKRASTDDELHQILKLQKSNSKAQLSEIEQYTEGFITVNHDFNILKKMNDACPHIIAKDKDKLAGYALVMTPQFRVEIAILRPMFEVADELLVNKKYVAMGQICIAKSYRKRGLFRQMYNFYRCELERDFDCLFTEVATTNKRSLEAHKRIGFQVLKTQITDGISWELMNWDWNSSSSN